MHCYISGLIAYFYLSMKMAFMMLYLRNNTIYYRYIYLFITALRSKYVYLLSSPYVDLRRISCPYKCCWL